MPRSEDLAQRPRRCREPLVLTLRLQFVPQCPRNQMRMDCNASSTTPHRIQQELLYRIGTNIHAHRSGQHAGRMEEQVQMRPPLYIYITYLSNDTELQVRSPIVMPSAPVKTPQQTGRRPTRGSVSLRLTHSLSAATIAEARFSAFSAAFSALSSSSSSGGRGAGRVYPRV